MSDLFDFNYEIRSSFKKQFILDCYKKKYLTKNEASNLRAELAKIEALENKLSHIRSIVDKTLSFNEQLPSSNLTI